MVLVVVEDVESELLAYLHVLDDISPSEKKKRIKTLFVQNKKLASTALPTLRKIARAELLKCRGCLDYRECLKDKESKAYKLELAQKGQ